jgi:lipoprotein signal peptidase
VTPRRLGALVAVAVLALDQAAKAWVLGGLDEGAPSTPLGPFVNLTLRWNRGVSFSLLTQDSALGQALLLGFTLAATALLGWWLWRSRTPLIAAALGAIIGGALGNALDRARYGAVVDFLDLHLVDRHFFVFNIADAAINVGVALLIVDLIFAPRARAPGAETGR